MSITFATLRSNVRNLMRDTNQADYATKSDELDREIIARLQMLVGESMPIATAWATGPAPSAGEDGDSFTPAAPIMAVLAVRFTDNGQLLTRSEKLLVEAQKNTAALTPRGRPSEYWLSDLAGSSGFNITLNTFADQSYPLQLLCVFLPPDATSGTLSISEYIARAVEFDTAAACIAKMDAKARERLRINADIIPIYAANSARLMDNERARTVKLTGLAHIAPAVY